MKYLHGGRNASRTMSELEPMTTSDTPFAAFLHYHSHQLIGMKPDPNDAKRQVYIFVKNEETPSLMARYYEGERYIDDCARYYKSIRACFAYLKGNTR